jgi:predicted nucleic acid-binding protein
LGTVILVDSNVLIDVFSRDSNWHAWSKNALAESNERDQLRINQVVVAEVAPQFSDLDSFVTWIGSFEVGIDELSVGAAYAGGKAFTAYRRRRKGAGENSKTILADFLIGGHAQVIGATILTRDPSFYRTYFASVPLITPDKADT